MSIKEKEYLVKLACNKCRKCISSYRDNVDINLVLRKVTTNFTEYEVICNNYCTDMHKSTTICISVNSEGVQGL